MFQEVLIIGSADVDDAVQVNQKLTATIEPSARVLVKMPVATAYCKTVPTIDFVLRASSVRCVTRSSCGGLAIPDGTYCSKALWSRLR